MSTTTWATLPQFNQFEPDQVSPHFTPATHLQTSSLDPQDSSQESVPAHVHGPSPIRLEDSKNPKHLAICRSVRLRERASLKEVEENVPEWILKKNSHGPRICRCVSAMFDWVKSEQENAAILQGRLQEALRELAESRESVKWMKEQLLGEDALNKDEATPTGGEEKDDAEQLVEMMETM